MTAIIIYTAIMLVSIFLGLRGFLSDILEKKLNAVMNVLLFVLLFILGLGLGRNKDIIEHISSLGARSFVFAAVLIVSSILSVKTFNTVYSKFSKKVKN